MRLRGRAHKYGANINTDVIIPARYLNISDPAELGQHCLEDLDTEFVHRVQPGDMIVAATNFGCGSSREHAPLALAAAGVSCVIAKSFARIFYRNAINIGLPILECAEVVDATQSGDLLEVELATGQIANLTRGCTFQAVPYPDFMLAILSAGGLIAHVKQALARGPTR